MPGKMARSGCPTAVRARRMVAAVGTAPSVAGGPENRQYSRQLGNSSGESRLISVSEFWTRSLLLPKYNSLRNLVPRNRVGQHSTLLPN
jgi:hypothetical protein